MQTFIEGIVLSSVILIWIFFICKNIENKNLKKYIKLLCALLIGWIILRIIKYEIVRDETIRRYIWYLYYIPLIFSSSIFMIICTWNDKNKKYIKILKNISLIVSATLFILVLTNDFHNIVFKFNENMINCETDYKYGVGYYICFVWIFANLIFGIITAVRASRGFYKKQKSLLLVSILVVVFIYAVGFIKKIDIIARHVTSFIPIYCTLYMFALIIIVYKEKYRQSLEEQIYEEIENSIKDKTILINKKIANISKANDRKRELAIIKMLVGYCKRKSNLIVIQKNTEMYSSTELEMFIRETIKDVSCLGITSEVNLINKFEMPIYVASILYAYIYNLFEYCSKYNNINMLISMQKLNDEIVVNAMIESNMESENIGSSQYCLELENFEYNFEMNQFMSNENIIHSQSKDENLLNIGIKIPINITNIKELKLTENEIITLLNIKSKVHDILGQRLSVLSSILENEIVDENKIDEIIPLLKNILDDLDSNKQLKPNEMLAQIVNTCELAGTKMYILGELPQNYIKAITLVKIIRECSTNAIRHGMARNVYVQITEKDKIEMTISDDGKNNTDFIEGDGIKGIRNRVKELNGSVEIITNNEFTIKVQI